MEADEDQAGGGRGPAHIVLVEDVCRERDADGLAHLIDGEMRDIRRGEAAGTRPFEGCVTGGQREHASPHGVAEHEVALKAVPSRLAQAILL